MNVRNITFDIPVIYYQTLYNIWKQIISETLYWELRSAELPMTLLPTGDFLITESHALGIIDDWIAEYYEEPEPSECFGYSLLVTIRESGARVLSASLSCSSNTSILSECSGRTILKSFLSGVLNQLTGTISTDQTTEIL